MWVLDWSGLWLVPSCCLDLSVFVVAGLFLAWAREMLLFVGVRFVCYLRCAIYVCV